MIKITIFRQFLYMNTSYIYIPFSHLIWHKTFCLIFKKLYNISDKKVAMIEYLFVRGPTFNIEQAL